MLKNNDKFPEDAQYLLEELSGLNYTQLQLRRNDLVSEEILTKFNQGIQLLLKDEPVQYILGEAYFLGEKFSVDDNVLIPRQETEEMVEKIIQDHSESSMSILDVGTGSGVIAISLALKFPDDEVVASDISSDALKVAAKNAQRLQTDNVHFFQSNLFSNDKLGKFDVIVSNPPYIAESEQNVMDQSVIKYEPDLALYGKNDGLDFYERFSKQVIEYLNPGGKLYMEFGYNQKNKIKQIFSNNMPDYAVEFYKDISGNYRYLKLFRKKG
ncbi:N5-glutamine S-adenosyl-L-methionine-dependent methyltransferase [Companilactobacillus versmoldensis DSM 14857 = KCTC 3814]|uniref:Release factor glutamine methyltransferase n=1 Tax=Companilactobacillus versmoldensis DSM 14857 = KCTC 3814 TaxID=1423815 RepID=A0A0R1SGT6_9LACO|nr:peptide chain release factor N(5)-glutamine methyltransferase [Companilactobacillus versmoldensis]KRL65634.1 N5-glutamine S-adenosyl-L-methionine-dependent methyltransferase [Companilactobacillus versmoldensis DSM 14857 = KCTC 3814]